MKELGKNCRDRVAIKLLFDLFVFRRRTRKRERERERENGKVFKEHCAASVYLSHADTIEKYTEERNHVTSRFWWPRGKLLGIFGAYISMNGKNYLVCMIDVQSR